MEEYHPHPQGPRAGPGNWKMHWDTVSPKPDLGMGSRGGWGGNLAPPHLSCATAGGMSTHPQHTSMRP